MCACQCEQNFNLYVYDPADPSGRGSKVRVCGRSLSGTAGPNLAAGMDVSLVSVVCCQVVRQADHSSRGVLPNVVCLSVIMNPR